MNFTDFIDDKQRFIDSVKDALNARAFAEMETLKKEMASDFIAQATQEQDK
jgi:hypothetical protein